MPYKNIVWVKLFWKELLYDPRFIDELNDEQKGLLLMLFLLAGATQNNIKYDPKYIKRALNLTQSEAILTIHISALHTKFNGIIKRNGFLKFRNFNKLHNYIGNSEGTPGDDTWDSQEKKRKEKNITYKVLETYLPLKNQSFSDKGAVSRAWARNSRIIKKLLAAAESEDDVIGAIKWVDSRLTPIGFNWTLETVYKQFDNYIASKSKTNVGGDGVWNREI